MNESILRAHAMVVARAARALVRTSAMDAENLHRVNRGYAVAYTEEAFLQVIEEEGIGENQVISILNGAQG
jgi:hypothetical protein